MPAERPAAVSHREVYVAPSCDPKSAGVPLLPEMEMLGHDRFPAAKRLGLPPHRHPTVFEICYVAEGHLLWHLENQSYALRRGDVFVTPPNRLHGGEDAVMQPCEIYWIQVRLPLGQEALPGLTAEQTGCIASSLQATTGCPAFPSSDAAVLKSAFAALLREHRNAFARKAETETDSLHHAAARASLQTLLIQVVRDAAQSQRAQNALSPPLLRSLHWMEKHLNEPFTTEEAAEAVKLSVAAFHERFQREVGTTPAEWRTQKRIEAAKARLLGDPQKSVTEIALEMGFGSSQYFATAFKRYTAHTPTEYRDSHKARPNFSPR